MTDDWLPKLLVRRLALLWAVLLITGVTVWFMHQDDVSAPQATVVTAVVGILATVVAFYQHQRGGQ